MSVESQIQSIVEFGEVDTFEVRTHVYVKVIDPKTRNRVRGYGHGVILEVVSYARASGASSSRKSSKGALA